MRLDHVHLENFRAQQATRLALGSRLTLLMGENGSGKTTVLDAIAIALGAILRYLPDRDVKGISFKRGDILRQEGRESPYALIKAQFANDGIAWDLLSRRDTTSSTAEQIPQRRKGVRALLQYLDQNIIKPWSGETSYDLPVIAYYGVNRALLDMPKRRRNFRKDYTRFTALVDSLNAVSRFRSALVWIYNKEEAEIKDLYPLDLQHTKVYHMTKDSQEDLLDSDEGLTGDTLIEGFNEVSAIFERMSDFEDERSTFSSLEEDTQ